MDWNGPCAEYPNPGDTTFCRSSCYGDDMPVRLPVWEPVVTSVDPQTLNIPEQTVNFTLQAVDLNNPPGPPTITEPANCVVGTEQQYTIVATDPDGDQVRYLIDWNMDGVTDQIVPATGYVNSGVPQMVTKTWATAGAKQFQVRTEDSKGSLSAWTLSENVVCYEQLTATCSASPANPTTSELVTWTASPSGGDGTYLYSWNGDDGLTGNTQAVTKSYATIGTKNASLSVTSGGQNVNVNCSVPVGLASACLPSEDRGLRMSDKAGNVQKIAVEIGGSYSPLQFADKTGVIRGILLTADPADPLSSGMAIQTSGGTEYICKI